MTHRRPSTPTAPAPLVLLAALLALAGLAPRPAAGQEPRPLTQEDAEAIADFFNRPGTTRVPGETLIATGTELAGDVAALGGPLRIAGTIRGHVLVINGDALLDPGARIEGSLTVVGGRLEGPLDGVAGDVTLYRDVLRFRRENGRITTAPAPRPAELRAGAATPFGRTDLIVAMEGSYNRVDGLPIGLGPRIELGHSNPTVLEGRLIYRTRGGLRFHPDELGYRVRADQFIGGRRGAAIGLGAHSVIEPIGSAGISDLENSLSTFVLHRDYYDHYERDGWSAHVRFFGRTRPYEAAIEYRSERHRSVAAGEPWSLLNNDEPWRPQPQVAEGDLESLRGWLRWDTRNDRRDPATGWLIEAELEQGLDGALSVLVEEPGDPPALVPRPVNAEFTTMRLDVRRYLRIGPRTTLALRALTEGSVDDDALPPQRQRWLGGEGSLPGYERFRFDCGAREAGATIDGFLPYHGCDRTLLFQAEVRYRLFTGRSLGRQLGLDFDPLVNPELVLFADAGRAWARASALGERTSTGPGDLRYDAGIGFRVQPFGVYLAVPFTGGFDRANVFIRLSPRI